MSTPDMSRLYEQLPDNSHAARAERAERQQQESAGTEKRVEKVVKGRVRTKKNELRKLTDVFITEDVHNVKSYILMDVLVPAIKKAIYDIVVNSLDMTMYGGRSGGRRSNADRVSYTDYGSSSRRDDRDRRRETRSTTPFDYDDIIFDTRAEADKVLGCMDDIIDTYGVVRVTDLFDLVGESSPHTAMNYGWSNIRNAKIVSVRGGGYKIEMPRAVHI